MPRIIHLIGSIYDGRTFTACGRVVYFDTTDAVMHKGGGVWYDNALSRSSFRYYSDPVDMDHPRQCKQCLRRELTVLPNNRTHANKEDRPSKEDRAEANGYPEGA